jgi:hypothetical protein
MVAVDLIADLCLPGLPLVTVIEVKSRETEFVQVREACNRLTEEINAAIVRAQATFVPSIAATPY